MSIQGKTIEYIWMFYMVSLHFTATILIINLLQLNISSTVQILDNVEIKADLKKGKQYFEGSVTFMKTLNEVLDKLILTVSISNLLA